MVQVGQDCLQGTLEIGWYNFT